MNRKQKVFERVVNPLLMRYMTDPFGDEVSIAKGIPMKYFPYFKVYNLASLRIEYGVEENMFVDIFKYIQYRLVHSIFVCNSET